MTEGFIEVQVTDLFQPVSGKPEYIRDTVDANPGPYPVYSASLSTPFGYIDSYDFDGDYLTWVMNGYGGRVQRVEGKFSATRDRGVLVPKDDVQVPDLTYLKFALEPELTARAVGRRVDGRLNEYTKVYPPTVEETVIQLPVDSSGDPDYQSMKDIGERLRRLQELKEPLANSKEQLSRALLVLDVDEPADTVSLANKDLFSLSIGKRVLRSDLVENGIPVFSANARVPLGQVSESNLDSFHLPSLLWGIDGIFDWNYVPKGEEFATTDHCGRLQVLSDKIDPEYLYYYLRSTRTGYGFDRVLRASLSNVREYVSVRIPLTDEGEFDLGRQRELAQSYSDASTAREQTVEVLERVLEARLGLSAAG